MDQQGKESVRRSYKEGCKRQAADLAVSKRRVAEAGVRHTPLLHMVSEWKPCMSPGHMP